MIDSLNQGFDAMQQVVTNNEKAALLAAFYETAYKETNKFHTISEGEYHRFLDRLANHQRARFEKKGTFGELAGSDGVIDLQEFQQLVDEIVTECDVEMHRLVTQYYSHSSLPGIP